MSVLVTCENWIFVSIKKSGWFSVTFKHSYKPAIFTFSIINFLNFQIILQIHEQCFFILTGVDETQKWWNSLNSSPQNSNNNNNAQVNLVWKTIHWSHWQIVLTDSSKRTPWRSFLFFLAVIVRFINTSHFSNLSAYKFVFPVC